MMSPYRGTSTGSMSSYSSPVLGRGISGGNCPTIYSPMNSLPAANASARYAPAVSSDAAYFCMPPDDDRCLEDKLFRALALYGFGSGISYQQPEDEREKERRRYFQPQGEAPRPSERHSPLVSRKKDGGLEKKFEQKHTEKDKRGMDKEAGVLFLLPYLSN